MLGAITAERTRCRVACEELRWAHLLQGEIFNQGNLEVADEPVAADSLT
jgi:hypothetical protein